MKNIIIIIVLSVLLALFVLSMGVYSHDVKYRCPNGCENNEFVPYNGGIHRPLVLNWQDDYYEYVATLYVCSKCDYYFKEKELIITAKTYNDSVANALPDSTSNTIEAEEWIVKVTYVIPPELKSVLDSLEKRIEKLEEKQNLLISLAKEHQLILKLVRKIIK